MEPENGEEQADMESEDGKDEGGPDERTNESHSSEEQDVLKELGRSSEEGGEDEDADADADCETDREVSGKGEPIGL